MSAGYSKSERIFEGLEALFKSRGVGEWPCGFVVPARILQNHSELSKRADRVKPTFLKAQRGRQCRSVQGALAGPVLAESLPVQCQRRSLYKASERCSRAEIPGDRQCPNTQMPAQIIAPRCAGSGLIHQLWCRGDWGGVVTFSW